MYHLTANGKLKKSTNWKVLSKKSKLEYGEAIISYQLHCRLPLMNFFLSTEVNFLCRPIMLQKDYCNT